MARAWHDSVMEARSVFRIASGEDGRLACLEDKPVCSDTLAWLLNGASGLIHEGS